jgi:D-glycero-alpha-D-manno-heptose 1-phosphate guanylyltransferase
LSVGYKHEVIKSYFGYSWGNASIEYIVEKEPLGTGGALLLATQEIELNKRFLLLNGDTYFPIDLVLLTQFSAKVDSDWSLSLFKTDDIIRYMGVALNQDDQIISFKDLKIHGQIFVNGGVYLIHPRALNELRPKFIGSSSLESDIFPAALSAKQRIYGLKSDGKFIDIGIPYDYQRASNFLERRQ